MAKSGMRAPGHLLPNRGGGGIGPKGGNQKAHKIAHQQHGQDKFPHTPEVAAHAAGPSAAGAETAKFAKQHRDGVIHKQVDREEVERAVSTVAPITTPSSRWLPEASRMTRLAGAFRDLEEDTARGIAGLKVVGDSLRKLLGMPRRFFGVIWNGRQHRHA